MIKSKDYEIAFRSILPGLHSNHSRVLEALMQAPLFTASGVQLARLLDFSGYVVANQSVGLIGKELFKHLKVHPEGWKRPNFQFWTMFAEAGNHDAKGFPWKLRPNVVTALKSIGFGVESLINPDELLPSDSLWEGNRKQVWVNVFERNPQARQLCLQKYGFNCSVCGLQMELIYGPETLGLIHVHHLKPLSETSARYEIDPYEDLRPVCPNCHAVLHYGGVTRSLEDVKKMMNSAIRSLVKSLPTS